MPPYFDTSIQTQFNIDHGASSGANYEASAGLDQITNHHVNADVNNNYDSQSFETPWGELSFFFF